MKGKTIMIGKDPQKETIPGNYRPITCLPRMWKILTARIKEYIFTSRESEEYFEKKRKYAALEQEKQMTYYV